MSGDTNFSIKISVDQKNKTLTISDNGIGMNENELDENLGTIARSGTGAFVESLSGDESKDVGLIGQFGVGFYSAFMVAEKVDELQEKGRQDAWRWSSDGLGEYTVEKASKEDRGSSITLYLKKDAKEFLEDCDLGQLLKRIQIIFPFQSYLSKIRRKKASMRPLLFGHGKERYHAGSIY